MKRILITHDDLDGAGCAITFIRKYPDIEVQYHNYNTITKISQYLLAHQDEYDNIFFADISPEEPEGIQMLNNNKFVIIDHHETRKYLRGTDNYRIDYCGTWIAYKYLFPDNEMPIFIKAIDAWDMWKLGSPYRIEGEHLNLLCGYYGQKDFVNQYGNMECVDKYALEIINIIKKIKLDYLNNKIQQMKIATDDDGNKYWRVHVGESQSGLGNILEMIEDSLDIKYLKCVNFNDKTVSLYSLDFDVSEIAKKYGGGGHIRAAGYSI